MRLLKYFEDTVVGGFQGLEELGLRTLGQKKIAKKEVYISDSQEKLSKYSK